MSQVILLVRHSSPEVIPECTAKNWRLSEEGRRRCGLLANRLATYDIEGVVSSREPKAIETADMLADALGIPRDIGSDLHEHERDHSPSKLDRVEFESAVHRFFTKPGELILGNETADHAHDRFSLAVKDLAERHVDRNLAVVTHGTVLALLVSRVAGIEPFTLWKRLDMPSFAVLTQPDLRLVEVVESVTG